MNKKKIHFLGINGSGSAGVACLAKLNNYEVDGCDLNINGDYTKQLNELDINIFDEHSKEHLKNVDKLVVSAAIYFNDKYKQIPEVIEASKAGIDVVKWQTFINEDLAKNKELISICGTHGKTTTTTFLSNILEDLGEDPIAIIGGINKKWDKSYRNGNGKYFVCESDEYGENFLSYYPKYIVINNLEMEHPEFFSNFEIYKNNFSNFIKNIQNDGIILFNADCKDLCDLINENIDFLINKNVKIISYTLNNNNNKTYKFIKNINIKTENNNSFKIDNDTFYLNENICGEHNIRNCCSAVLLLIFGLNFNTDNVKKTLLNLFLPKRRMDKVYNNDKIVVYDDYAHHHTQILYNLQTLKNTIGTNDKIIAILEPHLISRFRDNSEDYIKNMEIADFPIITKFYKSREKDLNDLNMTSYLKNSKVQYIESFDDILRRIMIILDINKYDKIYILVMGAGLSYKLTKNIVDIIKNN